jgi:hypothetical protein
VRRVVISCPDSDTDAEGSSLIAALINPPSHGVLTLNLDGSFTYVHDGSAFGDSFTYKAEDGNLASNLATVTLSIFQPICVGCAKTTVLDAYERQSYTYGTLVRRLNIQRDPSRLPLTEVQFNLERVAAIVRPLLEFPIEESIESAPVFVP